MKLSLGKTLSWFWMLALASTWVAAQDLDFRAPPSATDPSVPATMRDLAGRILPVYQENDPERYLSNLSALQMVAGDYPSAYATRRSLRDRRRNADARRPVGRAVVYDIFAHAKAIEVQAKVPFAKAYAQAFRDAVNRLDDEDAYTLAGWLATPLPPLQDGLQRAFEQRRAKGSVTLPEAVDLIWAYLAFDAYRSFGPLVGGLAADEDRRRYVAEENLVIKTADGATLTAMVVRPKIASKRLPALLEFTIYESQHYAKEAAAHGYAGIVAYARGVHGSPDKVMPFDHDGEDARAVIEWIAKQPWSNGRVGMYGSGYNGFTAWAAAKHLPPALKAIATSDAMAPGVDVPMSGNIFRNSAYRWVAQAMNVEPNGPGSAAPEASKGSNKPAEDKIFTDDAQWRAYEQAWYTSGRRYREFPGTGASAVIFRRWLSHPSYDRYWQKMVPFREQFAHINIPVLTTTGYYADGQVGALYYFTQHYRYNTHANHTLVIGPYDDGAMQRGPSAVVQGYQVDPAALVDLRELRYHWFDHVLKGAQKPALLTDRVNYQMMGTNEWRHASSLEPSGKDSLRFYLEATPAGDVNRLTLSKSPDATFLPQTFDLADRSDAGWAPASVIISKGLEPHNGELFVSEPLQQPMEVSGLLTGHLDFTVNKMDMDLHVSLYEQLPNGDYLKLFDPSYEFRASYARDRVHRRLLRAGERQQLTFHSERMTSRKLQVGSRVVMILGINKRPDRQVNYGTGDDVSEESIDDARVPLRIRWYGDSYIEVPVRK